MSVPVKYPLAKLLKEKGFDLPLEAILYSVYDIEDESLMKNVHRDTLVEGEGLFLHAPTIDEVKWWLYRKHGYWITLGYLGENEFNFSIQNKAGWTKIAKGGFKLPTEAYEVAFEYTLNNLL